MRHFATAKAHGDLDLVAIIDELHDLLHLGLVVVVVDIRPHLDFLDLDGLLTLAGSVRFLLFLVFEFTEVHQLADGRPHIGRNFDKVEPDCLRSTQCINSRNHTVVVPLVINQPDFTDIDHFVGARSILDRCRINLRTSYGFSLFIPLRDLDSGCHCGKVNALIIADQAAFPRPLG